MAKRKSYFAANEKYGPGGVGGFIKDMGRAGMAGLAAIPWKEHPSKEEFAPSDSPEGIASLSGNLDAAQQDWQNQWEFMSDWGRNIWEVGKEPIFSTTEGWIGRTLQELKPLGEGIASAWHVFGQAPGLEGAEGVVKATDGKITQLGAATKGDDRGDQSNPDNVGAGGEGGVKAKSLEGILALAGVEGMGGEAPEAKLDLADLIAQAEQDNYRAMMMKLGAGIAAGDVAGGLSNAADVYAKGAERTSNLNLTGRLKEYETNMERYNQSREDKWKGIDVVLRSMNLDISREQMEATKAYYMNARGGMGDLFKSIGELAELVAIGDTDSPYYELLKNSLLSQIAYAEQQMLKQQGKQQGI